MRTSVAHRNAEPLAVADDHVRTHRTGRLDESTGQQIRGHHDPNLHRVGLGDRVGQRLDPALVVRVLDEQTEGGLVESEIGVRTLFDVDAEVGRTGPEHGPRLREHPVGHDEPVHAGLGGLAAPGIEQHGHGLRRGGRLVEQAGIGQLHARQLANHRLEIQQRLQTPLGNLRLIGGVGRVPARVLHDVAPDHAGHFRRMVAHADVVAEQRVLRSQLINVLEIGRLGHRFRQGHRPLTQDGLGHGPRDEGGHGVVAGGRQHVDLVFLPRAEVTLDECSGCHVLCGG